MKGKVYQIYYGGLGNQMFMFASGFASSKKWGRKLIPVATWYDGKQRGKLLDKHRRVYELHKYPVIRESYPALGFGQSFVYTISRLFVRLKLGNKYIFNEKSSLFDPQFLVSPKVIVSGYLQCFKYFEHYRDELSEIFQLEENDEAQMSDQIATLKGNASRAVAVHVRRGDSLVSGNEWAGLLTGSYYSSAMKLMNEDSKFIIFSDSPEWCKTQKVFKDAIVMEEPDPVKTVRLMNYCDDFIIAGSTLSWWGSWLGKAKNKKIIAPTPFFREVPDELKADMVPNNWTRLQSEFA